MKDNPPCKMAIHERHQRLLIHELAWRALLWTETFSVHLPLDSAQQLVSPGSVLATSHTSLEPGPLRIDMYRIPSTLRSMAEATWSVTIASHRVLAFAFDIRQDLCIVQLPADLLQLLV
jgi:hypothetical protein